MVLHIKVFRIKGASIIVEVYDREKKTGTEPEMIDLRWSHG
jgi:hypothetical protein